MHALQTGPYRKRLVKAACRKSLFTKGDRLPNGGRLYRSIQISGWGRFVVENSVVSRRKGDHGPELSPRADRRGRGRPRGSCLGKLYNVPTGKSIKGGGVALERDDLLSHRDFNSGKGDSRMRDSTLRPLQ